MKNPGFVGMFGVHPYHFSGRTATKGGVLNGTGTVPAIGALVEIV